MDHLNKAPNISVEDFRKAVASHWENAIDELEKQWLEIGFSQQVATERRAVVINVAKETCYNLVADEQDMKDRLIGQISSTKQQIFELIKVLGKQPIVEPNMGLYESSNYLRNMKTNLENERKDLLEEIGHLSRENKDLSGYLGMSPFQLPNDGTLVQALADLKKHTRDIEKEQERKMLTYNELKKNIVDFSKLLERSFESDETVFEVVSLQRPKSLSEPYLQKMREITSDLEFQVKEIEVQCIGIGEQLHCLWNLLNVPDEERQEFFTTVYTPSSLTKLKEELARVENLRKEHLETVLQELKKKLFNMWDRCHVGKSARKKVDYVIDETSERAFEVLQAELTKWFQYFESNAKILEKIEVFLSLFDDMLQLEDKCKDPTRLFNTRGASLLREAKERKRLQMEIPRLQDQLTELSDVYEKENKTPFMIEDEPLIEYIEKLWEMHEFRKKHEKSKITTPSRIRPTPPRLPRSNRKRPREEADENKPDRLAPRKLMNTISSSAFPSSRNTPLTSNPAVPSLRSTMSAARLPLQAPMSYKNFKTNLQERSNYERLHSSTLVGSLVDAPLKGITRPHPPKVQRTTRTPRTPVRGGCSGGAFLRRSQSQNSLGKLQTPTKRHWL